MAHGGHHPLERLLAILELLRLRDEAVGLDGVAKTGGRLLAPLVECLGLGQPIETVVDLNRVELFRITLEPQALRHTLRTEDPAPVLVHPAGTSDVNAAAAVIGNS